MRKLGLKWVEQGVVKCPPCLPSHNERVANMSLYVHLRGEGVKIGQNLVQHKILDEIEDPKINVEPV